MQEQDFNREEDLESQAIDEGNLYENENSYSGTSIQYNKSN